MIKKILLIAFVLLNVKVSVAVSSISFSAITPPTLLNFRIDSSTPNRVYFDSSEPIVASNIIGFTISLKNISSITVNTDQTIGHYFTVSNSFTFWDNNTIRYEGGSDVVDVQGNELSNFALTYIENNIAEPTSVTEKYVSASGAGNHDGSSEANAYTLSEMVSNLDLDYNAALSTGLRYNLRAGNYGNATVDISDKSFSAAKPVIIEGYHATIGDNPVLNWTYTATGDIGMDGTLMPLFDGANNGGTGFDIEGSSFIIIKNIQVRQFLSYNFLILGSNNIRLDNTYTEKAKSNIDCIVGTTSNVSIINSSSLNGFLRNFGIRGLNNLVKNCKSYCNYNTDATDYYYTIGGTDSGNILKDCLAYRENGLTNHTGHACSVSTPEPNIAYPNNFPDTYTNEYILVDGLTAVNQGKAVELRHDGTKYCVVRNLIAYSSDPNDLESGGMMIRDGSSNNIIENSYVYDSSSFLTFWDSNEIGMGFGSNNIIRNCISKNNIKAVTITGLNNAMSNSNNQILNSTFYNSSQLFRMPNNFNPGFTNFVFKNNIFQSISTLYYGYSFTGISFDYNNFYNSWTDGIGPNDINFDPQFVDVSNGDFRLKPESELIDKGANNLGVNFDFEQNSRPQGSAPDIGAYEYVNSFIGSVTPDTNICFGDSIILVASGGSTYLWNTEETTDNITVTPELTTTYTVIISDGNNSVSKDVTITVDEAASVLASDDVSICFGEEVTLTATGVGNFTWSNGETGSSITVIPTDTTTYTVTASNSCTSDAVDTVVVTVNSIPDLNAGNDIEICVGGSIDLIASGSGDFVWSTGETTASITVSPTTTTTYTVTSTIGNCSISDDVIVTVSNPPSVSLGVDTTICYGENIILTAEGNGNFVWSTGETSESITVSPNTTTTYSVTATSACDSTGVTDEIMVNITPEITIDAGADVTICQGENIVLTASGNSAFLWSTGETSESITVSPSATTTYSITSTEGNCSKTDEIVVTVDEAPSVSLEQDTTICFNESIILTAVGNGNFVWSTGETTPSITVSPTTTTTYSVTATSSCDTTGVTDDIVVNVTPEIILDAGNDVEICQGENITLTASGNSTFLWSTNETTASITVNPSITTTYYVTSTVGNCSKTDEIVVTVNEAPSVSLVEDATICSNESITLTAEGNGDFVWSTGETTQSITVSPTTTSTYSVTATSACNTNGVSDEIVITVNNTPNIDAGDDVTIEIGSSTSLTAVGDGNFLWSTGETTSSINVSPSETTSYTVTATLESGCSSEDTVVVTIIDSSQQVVANAGDDVEICMNAPSVVLTASGGDTYLWNTGEITQSITVNPTETISYTVTVSNSHSIDSDEVTIFVDEGCSGTGNRASIIKEIKLYPNPTEGQLNIELNGFSDELNISLFSLNGSIVYSEIITNYSPNKPLKKEINLSRFGKGIYFVRVTNKDDIQTKKVLVI